MLVAATFASNTSPSLPSLTADRQRLMAEAAALREEAATAEARAKQDASAVRPLPACVASSQPPESLW